MCAIAAQEEIYNRLHDRLLDFKWDPYGFALYAYPWGEGELANSDGPRTWQREIMEIIGGHLQNPQTRFTPLQVAVCSGHGIGKLHCKSLVINDLNGTKRWGDIRPGDLVFGGDGRPVRVKSTHEQGVKPIYRVTFDDGSYTLVGLEHLWNVRGRQERRKKLEGWRTLTTEQILELGVLRSNGVAQAKQWEIPIQGAAQFEEREIDLHPYFFGIWLGDGTKGIPQYTKPFPELVERLRSLGMQVNERPDGKHKRVIGISHLLTDAVFSCGSHERYIPDSYKFNTVENRRELLRGLLDTDGEANSSGSIGYSSTSKRLCEDVIWLVRSLGGKAMMQDAVKHGWYPDGEGGRVECRDCYRATINLDWNPFTIEHRRKAWKPSEERYLKRWIESIEYSHDEDAMCISVDAPDGLYLANDFIVTHNTSLIAMLTAWAKSTCRDCRVKITANTGPQLDTITVPEVSTWFRRLINADWWDVKATSIKVRDTNFEKTWRTDFVTWSAKNPSAFAGLHNYGKRILYIFDEASGIDDIIWETTQGSMSDENTEIIWLAFGNPIERDGRFAECFGKFAHRWVKKRIDSRTVEGTNKEAIQKDVDDWGEDSDFVRARWRGEFPRAGSSQFIPSDSVAFCRKYKATGYSGLPKIMAVDVARFGDDQTTIGYRQGRKAVILAKYRGLDTVQVAEHVIEFMESEDPDAVVIDGDGLGAGVVDHIKHRGFGKKVFEFH